MEENSENLEQNEPSEQDIIQENKNIIDLSSVYVRTLETRCNHIKNANIRGRAFLNLLTEELGMQFFKKLNLKATNTNSLQNIKSILSRIDIAEIFTLNNRFGIRYVFDDTNLFIPKKQDKYNMISDFYMFIKINFDNQTAELLGFIPFDDINPDNSDNKNFLIKSEQLKTFDEIKDKIKNKSSLFDETTFESKSKNEWIEDILKYLNGKIEDKIAFLSAVSDSQNLRFLLKEFEKSETIFNLIADNEQKIKEEISKEISSISNLADAFIQSKNVILNNNPTEIDSAKDFKLECARANLEKLFNNDSVSFSQITQNIGKELSEKETTDIETSHFNITNIFSKFFKFLKK